MRLRNRIVIVATAVLGVGGIIALVTWRSLRQRRILLRSKLWLGRDNSVTHRCSWTAISRPMPRMNELVCSWLSLPRNRPIPSHALPLNSSLQFKRRHPKQSAKIKFLEGKAHYQQGRYDLAEDCWTEALRLDPMVPEAGWVLIDLLDKEGRQEEAHRLGMRLHRDRARSARPGEDPP